MKKIMLAAVVLIASMGTSIANDWLYSESKDEMRDKVRYAATLTSEKIPSSTPDSAVSLDIILLSDDADVADKVGLNLSKAQYVCESDELCDVKIRFDNGRIENLYTFATDPNKNLLLLDDPKVFVEKLRLSKRVIIELPVLGGGRLQFKFSPEELKWQGVDSNKRYLSEFAGINLKSKIDLAGKEVSKKNNGLMCFDDSVELIKEWIVPAKICTYDGMISFISIEAKNDKKRVREIVADINKSLGATIKIRNGVAMWLSEETFGITSITIMSDEKKDFRMDFFYNPVSSKIPE